MKSCFIVTLCSYLLFVVGCGGGPSIASGRFSNLQPGAWEFRGTTQTTGYSWVIESIINPQGNQFAAAQNNLLFVVTVNINGISDSTFGGICDFVPGGINSLNGSVDGAGGVTVNFSDPLDSYTAKGVITNGTAILGSYTGPSSDCPYFGSFTGSMVSQPLSGTFSGTVSLANGAVDTITVTLSQSIPQSNPQLSIMGTSVGTDSGPVTLTGNAIANGIRVQGNIGSNPVSLFGLYVPAKNQIVIAENSSVASSEMVGTLNAQ